MTARLALTHLTALDLDPVALVEAAAGAGISAVCLRTSPAVAGGLAYPLHSTSARAALRRTLAATGVVVLAVEQVSLSEALDLHDCEPIAEVAADLGATRLAVAGDDDVEVVADRLAALAELVRPYGLAVDLEFMPFRPVRTLADAVEVVRRAACPATHVIVDALHLDRSGGSPGDLAVVEPALLGPLHLCDAPAVAPPADELAAEARTRRLTPGSGGLPLTELLRAMPTDADVVLEVPVAARYPHLAPAAAIALVAADTRRFLARATT